MDQNPFIYGRAVIADEFLGRRRELRYLFSRLSTQQSTAIVGEPHIGKTSLLKQFNNPEIQSKHFTKNTHQKIFSLMDVHSLYAYKSQTEFWDVVLRPLQSFFISKKMQVQQNKFQAAKQSGFKSYELKDLFTSVKNSGLHFVLSLDEFDSLLKHPVFNSVEFYGQLRSLASFTGGLSLVIATRNRLEHLNQLTQPLNPLGSPFFNFLSEIHLGALDERSFAELLHLAQDRFDIDDRSYIMQVSGRHPFLAQTAAAMLWNAHEEGLVGIMRYKRTGKHLYEQTRQHLTDTWNVWDDATRKVITYLAIMDMPDILGRRRFRFDQLSQNLSDYRAELGKLELDGIVTSVEGSWKIAQRCFLWWLADELKRSVRAQGPFQDWLQMQEVGSLFSKKELKQMKKVTRKISSVLEKGSATLIESFAKGVGQAFGENLKL